LLRTGPIPLFHLSRLVRNNNLKVVLTGEGADEVFGGYNIFKENKIRRFWARRPDSDFRSRLFEKLYPYIFRDTRSRRMLKYFFGQDLTDTDNPLYSHMIRWKNTSRMQAFFSHKLKAETAAYENYEDVRSLLPEDFQSRGDFEKAQYLEMKLFMANYLLSSQGDRMAMANSVEIRVPYLDHRLIEFMSRIPAHWKIRGLHEKYIFKKTVENMLPHPVVYRPKNPYRAPINQGLAGKGIRDFLTEESILRAELFDWDEVSSFLNKLSSPTFLSEINDMTLVGIISSQYIHSRFIQNCHIPYESHKIPVTVFIDRRTQTRTP
jgi:asparagine synthase (glutamine-hydrolysing)